MQRILLGCEIIALYFSIRIIPCLFNRQRPRRGGSHGRANAVTPMTVYRLHSHAAPRTPLESPNFGGKRLVAT